MDEDQPKTGAEFLDRARRAGATVAGRRVAGGWGVGAFARRMVAHHWTQTADLGEGCYGYKSECGLRTVSTPQVPLFGAGNAPFCARCENRLMRAIGAQHSPI